MSEVYRTENGFRDRFFEAVLYLSQKIKVPSKELPEPGPITLYDSQLRFLHEVDDALAHGQHFVAVTKSRQLGLSTIMLLMDICWLAMKPGLQGALIGDTAENVQTFRDTITAMLDSMPAGFRIPIKRHNRAALILANGSRLQYLNAGKRKNPDLGRSRGLNFVHGSECSGWGDQDGFKSLVDSLATENPNRLYIFESTCKGFNLWHDVVQEAKTDPLKRAMFIGWWAKHTNRIPERLVVNGRDAGKHPKFVQFWDANPTLTEEEQMIAHRLKADYGVELNPEQWAWWRNESATRPQQNRDQEQPWHEEVAFQVTGHQFFSGKKLTADMNIIHSGAVTFDGYKYHVGEHFTSLRCEKAETLNEVDLRVWEGPVKGAKYVMGIDVAYGRSSTNDRHSISVWRCYADKLGQVAEWATSMPETKVVAWVLGHLAGAYGDVMLNLETNGPGQNVLDEVTRLRSEIQHHHLFHVEPVTDESGRPIFNHKKALDQARYYLFHRPDTPYAGFLYGFKTTSEKKQQIMNGLRNTYSMDALLVRSGPLLDEMSSIVQDGVSIGARPGKKDDRVMSAALAHQAWLDWVKMGMLAEQRTYAVETARQKQVAAQGIRVIDHIIPQHFKAMAKDRQTAQLQRLLGRYESN